MRSLIALLLSLWLAPAWAQLPMTGAGKGAPTTVTPFAISQTNGTSAQDTTSQTTYTFTSQSIGAADASRVVAAVVVSRQAGTVGDISSVTIGGVSATQVKTCYNTAANTSVLAIWVAAVPTGTTATVSVVFPSAMLRAMVSLYRIVGSNGSVPSGAAIDCLYNTSVGSVAATVTVPSGGGSVIGSMNTNTATVTPTNYTEDIDTAISTTAVETGNDTSHSGSTTYTATFSTSASGGIVAAAWSP